jgi:hypothetical protein
MVRRLLVYSPRFLRESGYTITVLLEQDLAAIKKAANERKDKSFKKERQGWTVPSSDYPRLWRLAAGMDFTQLPHPTRWNYSTEKRGKKNYEINI